MSGYLTANEAAAYTKCHPVTLREAARKGEVKSSQRRAGAPRFYKPEWLDAWRAGERPRQLRAAS